MMRRILVALLVGGQLAAGLPSRTSAQVGFDRRGGDYSSLAVRSADPAACAALCERDARCRAWSFSYPAPGRGSTCWLKSQVPPRVADACCVSGVKGAAVTAPRDNPSEIGIDRFGGDYRSFDSGGSVSWQSCKTECESDDRCRAWTFVRAGYAGPSARCFLKEKVMPPRRKPCCVSGVVK